MVHHGMGWDCSVVTAAMSARSVRQWHQNYFSPNLAQLCCDYSWESLSCCCCRIRNWETFPQNNLCCSAPHSWCQWSTSINFHWSVSWSCDLLNIQQYGFTTVDSRNLSVVVCTLQRGNSDESRVVHTQIFTSVESWATEVSLSSPSRGLITKIKTTSTPSWSEGIEVKNQYCKIFFLYIFHI